MTKALNDNITRQFRIGFLVEQTPDAGNRVTLSDHVDGLGLRRPKIAYHAALETYLRRHAPDFVVPLLDPGDMVVFASTTPHGTLPFRSPSRWAMQVIVRPSNLRWSSWPEFAAGISSSPKDPWRSLKEVGTRWRIVSNTAA